MTSAHPHLIATTSPLFVAEACRELEAVARDQGAPGSYRVAPTALGLIFVTLSAQQDTAAFLAALRQSHPIFTRHIHAVDRVCDADGLTPEDLEARVAQTTHEVLSKLQPDLPVAVQVRRLDSKTSVTGGQIAAWLKAHTADRGRDSADPSVILSCTAWERHIYLGLGEATANLSPRMGGAVHYDMSRFPVSRAGAKLAEAFEVFALSALPQGSRAIDLGAAPGGWTAVLVERGFFVDAIDPGDMHPSLAQHPHVKALKIKAQDFKPARGGYDFLTCDVNWSAKDTAAAVLGLAPHLSSGALALVTIKLTVGTALPQIAAVKSILNGSFEILDVRLLFHNRREVTLLLKRRGT